MADEIEGIVTRISADTEDFDTKIESATKKGEDFGKGMESVAKIGLAAVATAAVAAAGAIAAMTAKGIENVSRLNDIATAAGVAVEDYQALEAAFGLAGISSDQTKNALLKLNETTGEVRSGNAAAAASFTKLGLDIEELQKLPADERMAQIADAIAGVGDSADQAKIATDIFGKSGGELLAAFAEGGAGIRDTKRELKDLGIAISTIDAKKVDMAGDALDRMGGIVSGIANRFAVELSPAISTFVDMLIDGAKESGGFGDGIKTASDIAVKAIAFVMNVFSGLKRTVEIVTVGIAHAFGDLWIGIKQTAQEFLIWISTKLNKLPGVNIDTSGFKESIADLQKDRELMSQSFQDLTLEPLAGDEFLRRVEERKKSYDDEANAKIAAEKKKKAAMDAIKGGKDGKEEDPEKGYQEYLKDLKKREEVTEAHYKYMADVKNKFDADQFNLQNATEEQRMAAELARIEQHEAQRKAIADAAYNANAVSKSDYEARITQIEQDSVAARAALTEIERQQKIAAFTGMFGDLSAAMQVGGRKMFEIGKAASIASGLLSAHESIMSAYAAGSKIGGPWTGAAFAAAAGIAQFANLKRLSSVSYGSTSAGGGGSGGGGVQSGTATQQAAPAQQAAPRQINNFSIIGDSFSRGQMVELAERMAKGAKDGIEYRFAGA